MILENFSDTEALFYALTQDESGLDLAEFMFVDNSGEDRTSHGIFRAWPFQVAWFRNPAKQHVDAAARSVGKAIDVREPILTTMGWKTMKTIQVGDFVFSETGQPIEVTKVFKIMKDRDCYQITFDDETKIIVDGEHNWLTFDQEDIEKSLIHGKIPTPKVRTTVEIRESLTYIIRDNQFDVEEPVPNHRVPYIDGLNIEASSLTPKDLKRCVSRLSGYPSRKIVEVKPVESVPVRCITVDNPTSLFLVGESLIPTHNSMSIKFRAMAFPFIYQGEEMLITAPESVHLEAVTDNFESLVNSTRLMRELVDGRIKHKPFHIVWKTGCRTMGRIPQRDGHGVQGMHPLILEHDEGAAYPERGWVEIVETVKRHDSRSRWRCHGVSFGVGGKFNEIISGEDENWTVTRLPAMYRPTWTDEERNAKMVEYGGYDSSGYRRNILGLTADAGSPIFALHRLMAAIDSDKLSFYNENEYFYKSVDEAMLRDAKRLYDADIEDILDVPKSHLSYNSVWIGMDIGWTLSPSSICVFAEVPSSQNKNQTALKLLSRILLYKFSAEDQAKALIHLMKVYRPVVIAMDATGAGLPLWDNIRVAVRDNPDINFMTDRVKQITFSEKVIVGFDENMKIDHSKGPDAFMDAAVKRPFIEASTDSVRKFVDSGNIILPWDKELQAELQAAPSRDVVIGNTLDAYGRSGRKKGMHNLDAIRCAVFSYDTRLLDQMIEEHKNVWQPVGMIWVD